MHAHRFHCMEHLPHNSRPLQVSKSPLNLMPTGAFQLQFHIPFCVDLNGTGQANSQERSQERVGTAAAEYEFSYEFSALPLARKKVGK